jgi:demethylmenaquinone methyltransferase/2-methoxy-6-polyprenyl-1,4-benzoquinol methylase
MKSKKQNYAKQKPETVRRMFGEIAERYDWANTVLSFGVHKLWNNRLAQKTLAEQPDSLIDLCSGTGEIAVLCAQSACAPKKITLLDFSAPMLEQAKKKMASFSIPSVQFVVGDATKLPEGDQKFQTATMAYGIRNVANTKQALSEAYRVLKPGGAFFLLELTRPQAPLIRSLHSLYLRYILPSIGKLAAKDENAYKYLCDSIHNFIPPQALASLLEEVGFVHVKVTPLTLGVAHIIEGRKERLS